MYIATRTPYLIQDFLSSRVVVFANFKQNPFTKHVFLEATIDLQVNLLPAGDELEDDSLIKALLEHVERQDSNSSPRPVETTANQLQFRSFADVTTRGNIKEGNTSDCIMWSLADTH